MKAAVQRQAYKERTFSLVGLSYFATCRFLMRSETLFLSLWLTALSMDSSSLLKCQLSEAALTRAGACKDLAVSNHQATLILARSIAPGFYFSISYIQSKWPLQFIKYFLLVVHYFVSCNGLLELESVCIIVSLPILL